MAGLVSYGTRRSECFDAVFPFVVVMFHQLSSFRHCRRQDGINQRRELKGEKFDQTKTWKP